MNPFHISTDQNTLPTYAITFSDYINVQVLSPGVAESVSIPVGARFIAFSTTGDFYCRANQPATVPSADIVDRSGSELNPIIRGLAGTSSISLISPTSCIVTMAFYA